MIFCGDDGDEEFKRVRGWVLLHGVLLRSLFIRGTSVTGSAAPMSRPSVRPDAGKLTRRSPPSRRPSYDDPPSGDDDGARGRHAL